MSSWQRFSPILWRKSPTEWEISLESGDSFAVQKLFSLMSHLFIASFRFEPFEFCLGSFSLYLSFPVFPTVSWSCFKVSSLILRSLTHFELIWYRIKYRDLISVFCMWISSFPSSICWRGNLFSIMCFGLLCWKSVGYRCMSLYSDPLVFLSVLVPIPCCFIVMSL
jgi:hypothetical protein